MSSSVILAIALWQFHVPLDGSLSTAIIDPPQLLVSSIASQERILEALCGESSRFDIDVIRAVCTVLQNVSRNMDEECVDSLRSALGIIAHYRWCQGGAGIRALTDGVIQRRWYSDLDDWHAYMQLRSVAGASNIEERKLAIRSLSRRDIRSCQDGYFDLSIRYL